MAAKGVLSQKLPDERVYITADFTSLFSTGVTITDSTATCTRYGGNTDTNSSSLISGGTNSTGLVVSQLVIGGTPGTSYLLKFSATGSDSSVIDVQLLLPVVAVRLG